MLGFTPLLRNLNRRIIQIPTNKDNKKQRDLQCIKQYRHFKLEDGFSNCVKMIYLSCCSHYSLYSHG